jgi:hypothetical protein
MHRAALLKLSEERLYSFQLNAHELSTGCCT